MSKLFRIFFLSTIVVIPLCVAQEQGEEELQTLPGHLIVDLSTIGTVVSETGVMGLDDYDIEGVDIQINLKDNVVVDCSSDGNSYFESSRTADSRPVALLHYLGLSHILLMNLRLAESHPTTDSVYSQSPLTKVTLEPGKLFRIGALDTQFVYVPSCAVHPKHFQLFSNYASSLYVGGRTEDALIFIAGHVDVFGSEPDNIFEAELAELTLLTVSEAWLCGVKKFRGRVSSFSTLHVARTADLTSLVVDRYGEIIRDDCISKQ